MSVIRGKNVVFKIVTWLAGPPYALWTNRVIGCARSCTLTTTTSYIETTTKGTGKGATYRPQKNNTTGSLEGVVFLNEADKINLPTLRQMQLNHLSLRALYERTADDGSTYRDVFDFFITSLSDTGSVGDFNTFQMEIQVNGDPTIEISDNVPPERFVEWKWQTLEPILSNLLEGEAFTHSQPHVLNEPIEISLAGMPSNRWLLVRYSVDEADPTDWYNTPANNGTIPDSVFMSVVTIGSWKYIKSRTTVSFDTTASLKFTH